MGPDLVQDPEALLEMPDILLEALDLALLAGDKPILAACASHADSSDMARAMKRMTLTARMAIQQGRNSLPRSRKGPSSSTHIPRVAIASSVEASIGSGLPAACLP